MPSSCVLLRCGEHIQCGEQVSLCLSVFVLYLLPRCGLGKCCLARALAKQQVATAANNCRQALRAQSPAIPAFGIQHELIAVRVQRAPYTQRLVEGGRIEGNSTPRNLMLSA